MYWKDVGFRTGRHSIILCFPEIIDTPPFQIQWMGKQFHSWSGFAMFSVPFFVSMASRRLPSIKTSVSFMLCLLNAGFVLFHACSSVYWIPPVATVISMFCSSIFSIRFNRLTAFLMLKPLFFVSVYSLRVLDAWRHVLTGVFVQNFD